MAGSDHTGVSLALLPVNCIHFTCTALLTCIMFSSPFLRGYNKDTISSRKLTLVTH